MDGVRDEVREGHSKGIIYIVTMNANKQVSRTVMGT